MTALTYAGVLMPVLLQDGAGNAQTRVGVQVLNVDGTAASVYSDADRTPVTGQVASDGHGNVSGYFAEPGQVFRLVFHVEAQPVEVLTFSGIDVREIAAVKDTATAALVKSLNLADLTSASAARTNLGLGSAATQPTSAFDPAGAATAAQSAAISAASTDATSKVAAEATARASAITSAVSTLLNGAGPAYDTLKELQDLLTADESTATALAATVAARRAYVVHGATASTARPSSSGPVDWIGSVAPTNAIAGDEWRDTTTDPYTLKVKGTSGFGAPGGTSLASVEAFVVHGATASTARPAGAGQVLWTGSVAPTNALTGDFWWDTANVLFKRYNGTTWDTPAGGGASGVTSFNTRTGTVTLSKADVTGTGLAKADLGLGSVDNTADTAKPVSTAQLAALNLKEPLSAGLLGRRRERPIPFLVRELMANPPVVGATASATAITSPQSFYALTGGGGTGSPTVDASAPFTYLGAGSVAAYGTTSPNWNYVVFNSTSGSGISPSAPYRVRFGFDGTQLEILFKQLSGYGWELWVDGQLVSAPAASGSSPTSAMLPVTFSTRKPRVIEFRSQLPFRGVNVGPNDSVWAVSVHGPRVIIVGDSYVQGTGGTIPGLSGFAQQFGDAMGWSDVWVSGVGGTGYLNPGTTTKLGDRLAADVTSRNPDLVILAMGHNDTGYTAGTLTAEVAADITAIQSGLSPGGKILVVGPLFQGGVASTYSAVQTAIFAGATGADGTIDTVTAPWFTGSGKAGATTGSGNSDLYISSDGVHPTQAGHDYLARRLSAAVNNLLAA